MNVNDFPHRKIFAVILVSKLTGNTRENTRAWNRGVRMWPDHNIGEVFRLFRIIPIPSFELL